MKDQIAGSRALVLVVVSIAWKLTVVEGQIEPREIHNSTIVFYHDMIDGDPVFHFTDKLAELSENGYGLEENQAISVLSSGPTAVRTAR